MTDDKIKSAARPGWTWHDGLGLRWDKDRLVWIVPHGSGVQLEVGQGQFAAADLRELGAQLVSVADAMDGVAPHSHGGGPREKWWMDEPQDDGPNR